MLGNPNNPHKIGPKPSGQSSEAWWNEYKAGEQWIREHQLATEELRLGVTEARRFTPMPPTPESVHRHLSVCWGQTTLEEVTKELSQKEVPPCGPQS